MQVVDLEIALINNCKESITISKQTTRNCFLRMLSQIIFYMFIIRKTVLNIRITDFIILLYNYSNIFF